MTRSWPCSEPRSPTKTTPNGRLTGDSLGQPYRETENRTPPGAAALPFFVAAASFALAVTIPVRGRPAGSDGPLLAGIRGDVMEGLRWVWGQPLLRGVMVAAAVMNITFFATFSVRVLFATEILGLDTTGFGLLMAADGGGGIVGALTAARVSAVMGRAPTLVLAVALQAGSTVVFGSTSEPTVAWVALAAGGIGGFLWNVVAISVAQAITPERLLGRLNSAVNTVSWGAIPIGAALGGLLARTDLRLPYFISAAALFGTALLVVRLTAHLPEEGGTRQAPTPS